MLLPRHGRVVVYCLAAFVTAPRMPFRRSLYVHGVTIYFVGGLIASTCSAGSMLHARLLIVTLHIIGGVESSLGPDLMAENGMLGMRLALLPVACLVGLPYVKPINAHECWNTCTVNLGTIHATHNV